MRFLKSLFAPQKHTRTQVELEGLKSTLDAFLRASVSFVDSRDMNIPEKRERYALFARGAAGALAARHEMDETRALALLVMFLRTTARMQDQEVSNLVGACIACASEEQARSIMASGAAGMEQWLAGSAGAAVPRLAAIMRD